MIAGKSFCSSGVAALCATVVALALGQTALDASDFTSTDSMLCAASASPQVTAAPALDDLLARMDGRAKDIKTVEADITITNEETFSGHKTDRSGKLYVKKPDTLLLDLVKPWPRRIWISSREIVDYRPDFKTGDRIILADDSGERPQVIGLSTTSDELRRDFHITLAPPGEKPAAYLLTLVPKESVSVDFTSAEVTIDAATLLPTTIIQKNAALDEVKTYALSEVKVNPRLSDRLFEPDLPKGADVEEHKVGDWKGP